MFFLLCRHTDDVVLTISEDLVGGGGRGNPNCLQEWHDKTTNHSNT